MKLDLTVIKNESISKFEKAVEKTNDKFMDMLSLALDTAVHEIDDEARKQVSQVLSDLFHDELSALKNSYAKCLNKASELVENGLGS